MEGYVRCAHCGHDFPSNYVRDRGVVNCSCGMIIQSGRSEGGRGAGSALALLLLAVAIVLLTAVAVLAQRLG